MNYDVVEYPKCEPEPPEWVKMDNKLKVNNWYDKWGKTEIWGKYEVWVSKGWYWKESRKILQMDS